MHRKLGLLLLPSVLGGALAIAPAAASQAAVAVPQSIMQAVPGCNDNDYICGYQQGYQQGFLDGRDAKKAGLCAHPHHDHGHGGGGIALSAQGYAAGYSTAYSTYCPS